jgi:hypothetical protein
MSLGVYPGLPGQCGCQIRLTRMHNTGFLSGLSLVAALTYHTLILIRPARLWLRLGISPGRGALAAPVTGRECPASDDVP